MKLNKFWSVQCIDIYHALQPPQTYIMSQIIHLCKSTSIIGRSKRKTAKLNIKLHSVHFYPSITCISQHIPNFTEHAIRKKENYSIIDFFSKNWEYLQTGTIVFRIFFIFNIRKLWRKSVGRDLGRSSVGGKFWGISSETLKLGHYCTLRLIFFPLFF